MNFRKIILCADDYGQNKSISLGILDLVQLHRLSAISCMTTFSDWHDHAEALKTHQEKVDIGLHFNLTQGKTCTSVFNEQNTSISLAKLILRAFHCRLNQQAIEKELSAQIDNFYNHLGFLPDFIDGHQHVHHLPIIRNALLAVHENRLIAKRPYFRIASNPFFSALTDTKTFPKAQMIMLTGALLLKRKCIQKNIPYNHSFSGTYNFAKAHNYRKHFKYFLTQVNNEGLIMCHPGLASSDQTDPLQLSRFSEQQYFMSDAFLTDCRLQHIKIARFSQT